MQNFKPLAIFCGCTARFVLDLVGNPEDQFPHNEAHIIILGLLFKFVDFLYNKSEVFNSVLKVISSEKILFSLSFDV